MAKEVCTVTYPAFLASALINGDCSGLETPADQLCLERVISELAANKLTIVSIADDCEPRFTWHFRLYCGDAEGGDVLDYVAFVKD